MELWNTPFSHCTVQSLMFSIFPRSQGDCIAWGTGLRIVRIDCDFAGSGPIWSQFQPLHFVSILVSVRNAPARPTASAGGSSMSARLPQSGKKIENGFQMISRMSGNEKHYFKFLLVFVSLPGIYKGCKRPTGS